MIASIITEVPQIFAAEEMKCIKILFSQLLPNGKTIYIRTCTTAATGCCYTVEDLLFVERMNLVLAHECQYC
jgi:hypothetical protein